MDHIVQQILQITVKEDNDPIKRLLQLMRDAGIGKFDARQQQTILGFQSLPVHNVAHSTDSAILCKDTSLLLENEIHHEDKMTTILHIVTAHINKKTISNKTILHLSAKIGDQELVSIFLIAGADVNAKDNLSYTPLHVCAMYGHKEIVGILLKARADVDAKDIFHYTPLHLCARNGHTEIVAMLLKAGAAVDAKDIFRYTPLHLSARNGHKEIVGILLEFKATVDTKDIFRYTPLHLSAENGHKEIVGILLKAGADVDAKDSYNNTSLHLSARNGHKETVGILLKYKATIDAKNKLSNTPLHFSARNSHKEIGEMLLKAGATVRKNELDTHFRLKHIHASQRVDPGSKSSETLTQTQSRIYGATDNTTSVRNSSSTTTTVENNSTTVSSLESQILISEASNSNNDCDAAKRESLESVTSETAVIEPGFAPSGSVSSAASPPSARSHDLSDSKPSLLSNLGQQLQDHWANFSPKPLTEGCQITCTTDEKTVIQDRQITMSITININNIVNNIYDANVVSVNGTVSVVQRNDSNVNEEP